MANIKKTFNFRNGVQVDDDNLIVNATGLVGIGTTIPTEALDVRGTANIVGLITATTGNIGVLTVTSVDITGQQTISGGLVGSGVSIKSGVITATDPTGIVTYYGDARYLQGMPTSQWLDIDVGLGYSSIYNAGANVGIHTNDPRYALQIGGNNDINNFAEGVGINSTGSIFATGIITATSFVGAIAGPVTGNVAGNVTGNINSSGVSTIATLKATNVNISGLSTHRVAFTNASDNLTDSEDLTFNDTTNTLNVVGTTDTDQLNVSGVSTFSEDVITGVGATVGLGTHVFFGDNIKATFGSGNEVKMYHKPDTNDFRSEFASTNYVIMTQALDFKNQAGNKATITAFEPGGISEVRLFNDGNEKLRTTGFGVTIFNQLDTTNIVASGVITATTELNSPLVGVGTADPQTDIQVRKTNAAQIRVSSDTDAAVVSVGREPGAGNGNNAAFRYGNNSTGFPYSNSNALDIINYDNGNINFYLSATTQGGYYWHKGANSSRLMTLTNTGRLGIGLTNPSEILHVVGIATFTSNLLVGGNGSFGGNLTVSSGNLTVSSGNVTATSFIGNLTGDVTGNLAGNVNVTAGISSFKKIGINTTIPTSSVSLDCLQGNAIFNRVGIGSTEPDAIADFSGDLSAPSKKFIMLPKVSAGATSVLQSESSVGGALIYNTTLRKLQFYNGTNWETVTSVEVTG